MEKIQILRLPVPKLREEILKLGKHSGVSGMNKEQLVQALFEHHGIPVEEATEIVKDPELKKKIRATQAQRKTALEAGDNKRAKILQKKIHDMKRVTRSWTKAKIQAKAKTKHGG